MTDATLANLRSRFHGSLVLPGDKAYDEARAVWNAAIDRRPAAVARCADTTDVQRALGLASERSWPVAVRGGTHSFAGKATCDGGIVIDLTPMKHVEIDRERRVARAGAGCTLGDFDQATQAAGLATTLGTAPPTGISGLTLGGGIGWLMGRYGLACDNLVGAEVVTADGRVVAASPDENADLLWGLRGGGGNFGVVTRLDYRLHPVTTVYGGALTYPAGRASEVLRAYRDLTATAPDELTAYLGILPLATGPAFGVALCWSGDPAGGERAIAPLRRLAPLADTVASIPYLKMQSLLAPPPIRVGAYARSSFLRDLDETTIDLLAARASETVSPSIVSIYFLEHLHGAVSRSKPEDSSFAHRSPSYNFAALALWQDPADAEPAATWVRGFFDEVAPHLATAAYGNYLADEGDARVRAAYGPAWDRLVALKRTYDPANVFRLNQNVKP